jgi:cytochrome c
MSLILGVFFLIFWSGIPILADSEFEQSHKRIMALIGDSEYGEYLSSECATCHNSNGIDTGIPSITNWPSSSFVYAILLYKTGERTHPIMEMISSRLSDEEISSLALYYENIKN